MGDGSDHADVGRFMRTPEGQQILGRFRDRLIGKTITGVEFTHNSAGVGIMLTFDDRDSLDLAEAIEALTVETLRRRYRLVLDREYYVDFPERQG